MKMEMAEREDKVLTDMLDIIRFTEEVSAKLHRVMDEARIYQVVKEEFAKSDRWTASILLLADDGASLRVVETSMPPSRLKVLEKASGLQAKEYRVKLSRSSIYQQVVREGKTVQASVGDTIRQFLPQPLAYLISKTMGYDNKSSILAPLYKQGKVAGVLAVSSADLGEYFIHSVENLALHISTALELVHKHAQRNQALQALQKYQDHLGELVEERTAELKKVNEKLLEDIAERKKAEEALQESEEKYRTLVEDALVGIMNVDITGKITYVNKTILEATGYSWEEMVGKNAFSLGLISSETVKVLRKRLKEKLMGQPPGLLEIQYKRKDGEVILLQIRGKVIRKGGVPVAIQIIGDDITERKRVEEALQAEKNKLQSLIGALEYTLTIQDRDYNVIYQNELSRMPSGGDHLGEKCYRAYENREEVCDGCPLEEAFKDGKSHTAERRRVSPSGEVTFWENTASPIRDAAGEIVSCLEVARDITERKRMEQALADEVTRRRILVDQSLDGIVVLDEDARVVEANKRFAEMLGYSPEEVRELHTWDWDKNFPPEKLLEMGRAVDEKGLHLGTQHHRKDGAVIDVDISINGVVIAGQKFIFCVCRDITERNQAAKALEESQRFSSSLLESSPNPINVANLDTSIRYVNPAFEELTGFTLAEIAGEKAPYPWWPEGKKDEILAAFGDSIERGGRRSGIARNFRKKNGERFWVEISSAPVIQEGKPVYLIVSWLDVTERKRAEEKEKQLQRELYLAQRLASVGELAAGVAHEINNPLTGVLGFSQRLMRKSTDEELKSDLEVIHSEARRAADVVQNLLTFARRRQPKKEYANINDIVQKALELRAYALQTSNIEVTTALAHNLPQVMVDFPQMQEVFLNIILNAEQAMNEARGRGKLVIKTRRVKDHVRISFADDGPGISPGSLDKLFDPFFTTREQKGGTGLGLSACHGVVTEHGGRIYAGSKPGKGATFTVELPLSPLETTATRRV
jgi:PAS domain S-box-containing protein